MTRNQIELRNVKETERHNRATEGLEAEKNRFTEEHYIRADSAAFMQAAAAQRNAEANVMNALTNRLNYEETMRWHDISANIEFQKLDLQERQMSFDYWVDTENLRIKQENLDYQRNTTEWQHAYDIMTFNKNMELKATELYHKVEYDYIALDTQWKQNMSSTAVNAFNGILRSISSMALFKTMSDAKLGGLK